MTAYSNHSGTAPVGFARDDVTVILRRAAELSHERVPADETLTGRDLAEIADEVGMSRPAVAIAIAETRSGVTPPGTLIDRLVGPSQVWAHCRTTRHETEARQAVRALVHHEEIDGVASGDQVVERRAGGVDVGETPLAIVSGASPSGFSGMSSSGP